MCKLISSFLFIIILISCKEHSKSVEEQQTENVAKDSKDSLSKKDDVILRDSVENNQLNSLPFDFEKYTAVCLQQSSPDCDKIYPKLNGTALKKIGQLLGNKSEDIPTNIFQIRHHFKNKIDVYVIDFEGDSNFQEIISVSNNKIIARESIGYSMPEENTYRSFIIDNKMNITVYEINYENLKKKINKKFSLQSNGEILKDF